MKRLVVLGFFLTHTAFATDYCATARGALDAETNRLGAIIMAGGSEAAAAQERMNLVGVVDTHVIIYCFESNSKPIPLPGDFCETMVTSGNLEAQRHQKEAMKLTDPAEIAKASEKFMNLFGALINLTQKLCRI
ncbi:hypothetical protein K2X30_10545 [bacterium]|jgi:hypothetical protein|nr:hypothetical protein [bacterium]